jgi:multiple sugar transport system substrate-binding protein
MYARIFTIFVLVLLVTPFTCTRRDTSGGKIVLMLWTSEPDDVVRGLRQTLAEYERLHPDQLVKLAVVRDRTQKYLISMEAGVCADVINYHWTELPLYAPKKALLDLTDYIAEDGYPLDDYFERSLEAFNYRGRYVGLPSYGSTMVLFYNKDIFDRANLAYPDDSWTYDDFLHAAREATKLTDREGRPIVGILPYDISSWIWSMGGGFGNDDLSEIRFNDPATAKGVQVFYDFRYKYGISPKQMNSGGSDVSGFDVFERGNVAMAVNGPWSLQHYIAGAKGKFEWDVAPFPRGEYGRQTRYAGMGYGVWSGTRHPRQAWELMKFIQSKKALTERSMGFADIPARRSVAFGPWAQQEASFNVSALLTSISGTGQDRIQFFPKNEMWRNTYQFFADQVDLILLDEVSIEEGLNRAQSQAENYVSAQRYQPGIFDYIGVAALAVGFCALMAGARKLGRAT